MLQESQGKEIFRKVQKDFSKCMMMFQITKLVLYKNTFNILTLNIINCFFIVIELITINISIFLLITIVTFNQVLVMNQAQQNVKRSQQCVQAITSLMLITTALIQFNTKFYWTPRFFHEIVNFYRSNLAKHLMGNLLCIHFL